MMQGSIRHLLNAGAARGRHVIGMAICLLGVAKGRVVSGEGFLFEC